MMDMDDVKSRAERMMPGIFKEREINVLAKAAIAAKEQYDQDPTNSRWAANALGANAAFHSACTPEIWLAITTPKFS